MAADEGFYSFFGKGRCGAAHLPGTELQVEEKPIKARNKNDKRVFIKQETERVNIYHVGLLPCRLGEQLCLRRSAFKLALELAANMRTLARFLR